MEAVQFSIKEVIKTAWHNIKGVKWPIWLTLLVMILISLAISLPIGFILMALAKTAAQGTAIAPDKLLHGFYALLAFELIAIFATSPLVAGLQMTALKKIRKESVNAGSGFKYWHKWFPLSISMLLFAIGLVVIQHLFNAGIGAITDLANNSPEPSYGLILLASLLSIVSLLASLFYGIFFMFNLLFIADQNKGPFSALGHSAKIVAPRWFRVILLMIFLVIIYLIVALPFGLAAALSVNVWVRFFGGVITFILFLYAVPFHQLIFSAMYQKLSHGRIND